MIKLGGRWIRARRKRGSRNTERALRKIDTRHVAPRRFDFHENRAGKKSCEFIASFTG